MLCMLTDRVPRYALFLGAGYDWSMGQTGELSPVSRVKLRDWNPRDLTTRWVETDDVGKWCIQWSSWIRSIFASRSTTIKGCGTTTKTKSQNKINGCKRWTGAETDVYFRKVTAKSILTVMRRLYPRAYLGNVGWHSCECEHDAKGTKNHDSVFRQTLIAFLYITPCIVRFVPLQANFAFKTSRFTAVVQFTNALVSKTHSCVFKLCM